MSKYSHMSPADRLIYDHVVRQTYRKLHSEILLLIFMVIMTIFATILTYALLFEPNLQDTFMIRYALFAMAVFYMPLLALIALQIRSIIRAYKDFRYAEYCYAQHPLRTVSVGTLQQSIQQLQTFSDELNQTINTLTKSQHQLREEFEQKDAELQQQIDTAKQALQNQYVEREITLRQNLLALRTDPQTSHDNI